LTKYRAGIRDAIAITTDTAYSPMSTGMLRTIATAITSASALTTLTRGSSRCNRPGSAAMSSVNRARRMTLDAPVIVLST
jgi:hypothetical protein